VRKQHRLHICLLAAGAGRLHGHSALIADTAELAVGSLHRARRSRAESGLLRLACIGSISRIGWIDSRNRDSILLATINRESGG